MKKTFIMVVDKEKAPILLHIDPLEEESSSDHRGVYLSLAVICNYFKALHH